MHATLFSTFAAWLRHIGEAGSASSCLRELCHEEDAARFVALGDSRALPTRLRSPGLSGRTDTPIAQDETQFLPLVSRENKGEITMPGRRDPTFYARARLATCLYLLAQTTTAFAPGSPSQVAPVVPTMCKAPIPSTQ
jgi:hypothetical protein